jgi:hypothetical protein
VAKKKRHRLKKIQKYLNQGEVIIIGDGFYEKDKCNSCNKQHRVATIKTETSKPDKKNVCPSILSAKTSSASTNSTLPPIKVTSLIKDIEKPSGPKDEKEREYYRKMLNEEENALMDRLSFEKKLLEETEKKMKMMELEEAKHILGEHKKLEHEKRKYENITRRRMALEAMLKTLTNTSENSSKEKPNNSSETGGILRYNYSLTATSRKTVRIKDSTTEDTWDSDSNSRNASGLSSSVSKYLTYASSQYLTTPSFSDYTTNSEMTPYYILGRNESSHKILGNNTQEEEYVTASSELEQLNSSNEKQLKPKEEFMTVETDEKSDKQVNKPQEEDTFNEPEIESEKENIESSIAEKQMVIPTIVITSPSDKVIEITDSLPPDVMASPKNKKDSDIVVVVHDIIETASSDEHVPTPHQKEYSNIDIATEPSDVHVLTPQKEYSNVADHGTTNHSSNNITVHESHDTTNSFTSNVRFSNSQRDSEILDNSESFPNLHSDIQDSSMARDDSAEMRSLNSAISRLSGFTVQESEGTLRARSIICRAMENVIFELQSSSKPSLATCSSEEYLSMTATKLVRKAIEKVQMEVERQASNISTTPSRPMSAAPKSKPTSTAPRPMSAAPTQRRMSSAVHKGPMSANPKTMSLSKLVLVRSAKSLRKTFSFRRK